ncbi:MAG: DUF4221 domain-containing protein [Tannerella sp.]|nr:DUF4221 domain-containing protein [Tannerella sp.]
MKKFFVYSLLMTCFSCGERDATVGNRYGEAVSPVVTRDDISLDERCLTSYNILSTFVENGSDHVFAYNSRTHVLDHFNLTERTVSHIALNREGPDAVPVDMSGIYVHSRDSIWVYGAQTILLLDGDGGVTARLELPAEDHGSPMIDTNFSIYSSKLYYHPERNSVFYLTASVENDRSTYAVCEYSPASRSVTAWPLNATGRRAHLRTDYGWMQLPNVTYAKHAIIYNFPIESNVYEIDLASGRETVHGGKSRYTPNEVSRLKMPYSFEDGDRHMIENVHFYEVAYDAARDVYYRLHLGATEYDATADVYTLYNRKSMYLTVFNRRFEVIGEMRLDDRRYNYRNCWGVLGRGLFIATDNMLREDVDYEKLQYDLISFR